VCCADRANAVGQVSAFEQIQRVIGDAALRAVRHPPAQRMNIEAARDRADDRLTADEAGRTCE
jgi:hypothetical protein